MEHQEHLTPQVKEYQRFMTGDPGELGEVAINWVPYLMFFNRPGYGTPVINTDGSGFRLTDDGGSTYSPCHRPPEGPVSLVLGGSPAFGYGATADRWTVASRLAATSGSPWLNMAAPAFNSTQELVLFLLHRHRFGEVRDVVVMSGLNNLVIAGLPDPGHEYPQFFMSEGFFREVASGMPAPPVRGLRRLLQAVKGAPQVPPPPPGPGIEERIRVASRNVALDLDRLLAATRGTGTRVHYVLQPTQPWTDRPGSPEEILLLEEADAEQAYIWDLFRPVLNTDVHDVYARRLAELCAERDVPFLDLNAALRDGVAPGTWLFVDLVHLTDQGYTEAARIIESELALSRRS